MCSRSSSGWAYLEFGVWGLGRLSTPTITLTPQPWAKEVVTQPRRFAAISVARRVAEERGEQLPGEVKLGPGGGGGGGLGN